MNLPDHFVNAFVHGNCFEKLRELPAECVDLVLTDPPYGIDYQSNRRVAREKLPKFANDVDLGWVEDWVEQIHRVLKEDRHFYCFTRFDMYPRFYDAISRRFKVKNCLIWTKDNHGSGDLKGSYAPQTEMIIFATKGNRPLNGKRHPDILPCANVASANRYHATQKPTKLLRFLIEKSTLPYETVLDPFGGAGSTGFACGPSRGSLDHYPRNYCMFELNADFVRKAKEGGLGRQESLAVFTPLTDEDYKRFNDKAAMRLPRLKPKKRTKQQVLEYELVIDEFPEIADNDEG